jgi:perosamine synthetase
MERAEAILAERRRLAARYDEALADVEGLRLPTVPPGEEHGWQAYVCLYEGDRDALMAALEAEGIATRPGTHAPVETALYRRRYDLPDFPNARRAERQSVALPLFAGMTDDEQDRVVDALRRHGA